MKFYGLSIAMVHLTGKDPKMKQLLGMLFLSLFADVWMSSKTVQCRNLYKDVYARSNCSNTSSGKTCFTTFIANNHSTVRKPFEEASHWCKEYDPGSSLIFIDSSESQRIVESFIAGHGLANESIILGAQKLSESVSFQWSWVNGYPTVPEVFRDLQYYDGACVRSMHGQSLVYCYDDVRSQLRYICEYSDWKSTFSYRQNNKFYVASEKDATWYDARKECFSFGGDLASITDPETIMDWSWLPGNRIFWIGLHRNKWIWKSTGAALTYTNWKTGDPSESSDKQCICINPHCRIENRRTICEVVYDRKWWTCNCNHSYAIVCQKEVKSDALTTEVVVTEEMLPSTSAEFKSSASFSVDTSTESHSSLPSSPVSTKDIKPAKRTNSRTTTTRTMHAARTSSAIATTTATKTPATQTVSLSVNTTTTFRSSSTSSSSASSSELPITKLTSTTNPKIRESAVSKAESTTPTTIIITTSTKTSIATTQTTTTTNATTQLYKPVNPTLATFASTIADHTSGEISRKTDTTLSVTQKPPKQFAENQTTAFTSSSTGLYKSFSTKEILLLLLVLVVVAFIVAAVILIIGKRKSDRQNKESAKNNTKHNETVSSVYETVVPDNGPSEGTVPPGNTTHTHVEMTQWPTPSNNSTYTSVQPTSGAVYTGNTVNSEPNRPTGKSLQATDPIYL